MSATANHPSPYGCHNRAPYLPEFETAHGEVVPFRMDPNCQYTKTRLGQADPKCQGCIWRQSDSQSVCATPPGRMDAGFLPVTRV